MAAPDTARKAAGREANFSQSTHLRSLENKQMNKYLRGRAPQGPSRRGGGVTRLPAIPFTALHLDLVIMGANENSSCIPHPG
jgi:hypothetical protein